MSAAEWERMMKLQDVILRAMAKKITWLEAAEIIGVCDRTMRRMRERYQEYGYDGLFDQRRRKRTTLRVPMETAERVLALYRDTHFDLSVRHFHEKPREEHAIELSYTWVKQALQEAGLASAAQASAAHAGHAAAYRRQQASLVFRRSLLRSGGDPGRRHQRDLLRAT